MERREFIAAATMSTFALSFDALASMVKSSKMGVVVHSYAARWNSKVESKKFPGFQNAIELIEHCARIQAGGVQTVVRDWSPDFAKQVRSKIDKLGLYLEGSIALPKKAEDVATFEKEVINSKTAGATILRTVCMSGRRYENFHALSEFEENFF